MWWPFNKCSIIYIQRDKVILQKNSQGYPKVLDLPPQIYRFLDLYDTHYFEKILTNFLIQSNFAEEAIIVLSKDMVYLYEFGKDQTNSPQALEYVRLSVPLTLGNVATTGYSAGDNYYLVATNKYFINLIKNCCQRTGSQIAGIVPESMIETIKEPHDLHELEETVNNNKNLILKTNFA